MLEDFTSMHPLVIVYMLWKESEDCCALQTSCKLIQHTVATFVDRQWSCVANAPCTEALHHSFEHGAGLARHMGAAPPHEKSLTKAQLAQPLNI